MTSSRFDLGSTSKTLNLSLLRFNERSGSENLAHTYFKIKHDTPTSSICESHNSSMTRLRESISHISFLFVWHLLLPWPVTPAPICCILNSFTWFFIQSWMFYFNFLFLKKIIKQKIYLLTKEHCYKYCSLGTHEAVYHDGRV